MLSAGRASNVWGQQSDAERPPSNKKSTGTSVEMLRSAESCVGVLPIDEFNHWVVFECGVWGREQFLVVDGIGRTDRARVLGSLDDRHPNRHPYRGGFGQNANGRRARATFGQSRGSCQCRRVANDSPVVHLQRIHGSGGEVVGRDLFRRQQSAAVGVCVGVVGTVAGRFDAVRRSPGSNGRVDGVSVVDRGCGRYHAESV